MITIERVKIDRKNLILQIVCGILIVGSYFTTRILVFGAGILAMGYIFSNAKWEQKFSLFMFLLPFVMIFRYPSIDTSLFMFLRIAIVFCYFFQRRKSIDSSLVFLALIFAAYCIFVSEVNKTDYLVSVINIVFWIVIGYIYVNTVSVDKSTAIIRGFSNAVLITGIIGLFGENIPQFQEILAKEVVIAEDGAYISRYSGFFQDPNYFTIIVIASLWFIYYEFSYNKIKVFEFLIRASLTSFLGLLTMSKSCILLLLFFWFYILWAKNNIKLYAKVIIFFALVIAGALFISLNPYWLGDMLYRFTGGSETYNASTITTNRTDLWTYYIDKMLNDFTWILGNGINAPLVLEKGTHNNLILIVYCIGVIGLLLYLSLFLCVYNSVKHFSTKKTFSGPEKYAFISLAAAMFFLDGMYIEPYYYMMAMSFLYMLGVQQPCDDAKEYLVEESVAEI